MPPRTAGSNGRGEVGTYCFEVEDAAPPARHCRVGHGASGMGHQEGNRCGPPPPLSRCRRPTSVDAPVNFSLLAIDPLKSSPGGGPRRPGCVDAVDRHPSAPVWLTCTRPQLADAARLRSSGAHARRRPLYPCSKWSHMLRSWPVARGGESLELGREPTFHVKRDRPHGARSSRPNVHGGITGGEDPPSTSRPRLRRSRRGWLGAGGLTPRSRRLP